SGKQRLTKNMVAKSGEVSSEISFSVSQSRGRARKRRSILVIRSATFSFPGLCPDETSRSYLANSESTVVEMGVFASRPVTGMVGYEAQAPSNAISAKIAIES